MKVLALIPARGGSKGVPGKNQKLLAGKPLICYSIEAALACKAIDTLLVSTDDPAIADLSSKAGATVPFLRPSSLARDNSPTIDTVLHALSFCESQGDHYDILCLLQPTTPLRSSKDIESALELFTSREADSLISVREVPHQYNPHWVFTQKEEGPYLSIATGDQEIIPRRQELPVAYHRDGSIYLTKTAVIRNHHSLYGEKITWYHSDNPFHVNIDTPEDWAEAERLLARINSSEE